MDASAFSSLSAVARSCLAMWGAQFFIFEGAPFRLSLKSMPLAKIICKRHFHMSGEMVPPQYSPSNAARSFTIRGRAKCPRRRARSFDEGFTVSRPNAVGRDVIVTLYTESNFSFRLLVCGSSIDTQLCRLHEAFLFRANLLACLSLAKHKSDRAARRWASRHKNIRRRFLTEFFVDARFLPCLSLYKAHTLTAQVG